MKLNIILQKEKQKCDPFIKQAFLLLFIILKISISQIIIPAEYVYDMQWAQRELQHLSHNQKQI